MAYGYNGLTISILQLSYIKNSFLAILRVSPAVLEENICVRKRP
jgi:hypothetical protein